MKRISLFLIAILLFGLPSAEAQTGNSGRTRKKSAATAKPVLGRNSLATISAGVVNGKAIDLVKPEFPQAANAVNVYGPVSVRVLINENGDVISARAVSGHQLLRPASERAARQSKFEPFNLNGRAVKVEGTIVYNFLPTQFNWLEIGYILENSRSRYYLIEHLKDAFPVGFEEENQLLKQALAADENLPETVGILKSSIRGRLSGSEKAAWLFETGLVLGKIRRNCCHADEERKILANEMKTLVQLSPARVSPFLLLQMEKLVLAVEVTDLKTLPREDDKIYQILMKTEERLPFTGW